MGILELSGRRYSVDDEGFLDPPSQWDEAFAAGLARHMGILDGLGDEHWQVIRYLRRKLADENVVPYFVVACMENGLRIHRFRALFPTGYHRGACRLAGLGHTAIEASNLTATYELQPMVWSTQAVSPVGFLERFEAWDEGFAVKVAREWGFEVLGDGHHLVIDYLRGAYRARGAAPTVHEVCHSCRLSLDELAVLFPDGYRRGALRMAGLPPDA